MIKFIVTEQNEFERMFNIIPLVSEEREINWYEYAKSLPPGLYAVIEESGR